MAETKEKTMQGAPIVKNDGTTPQIIDGTMATMLNERIAEAEELAKQPVVPSGIDAFRQKILSSIVKEDEEFEEEEFLFSSNGIPFFSTSDVHTIGAKQKAGKTSLVGILLTAVKYGEWDIVKSLKSDTSALYIDTEMKRGDTHQMYKKIERMGGNREITYKGAIKCANFRPFSSDEMKRGMPMLIEKCKPNLVIIDGIVDFCANFNDVERSQELVLNYLMKLAEKHKCAIVCVLHTNKTDSYTELRGHLGAFLEQKGATVIKCEKDDNNIVDVTFPTHRYAPVPGFSFTFTNDGIPIAADAQRQAIIAELQRKREEETASKKKSCQEARCKILLDIIREHGGSISRSQLKEEGSQRLEKGERTVNDIIKYMLEEEMPKIQNVNKMITLVKTE